MAPTAHFFFPPSLSRDVIFSHWGWIARPWVCRGVIAGVTGRSAWGPEELWGCWGVFLALAVWGAGPDFAGRKDLWTRVKEHVPVPQRGALLLGLESS